ncbi:MAG: flagellar basal body rod protein FlgF [Vulcanimicrobiaceae bacterium]
MDGIHLMATALQAARSRLDVSATNLANVSSNGFQKRIVSAALTPAGLIATTHVDARPGPLRHTGRAFDLATAGDGAFVVRTSAGTFEPARSGSFERDATGHLHDDRGNALVGTHGPIVVDADATIDASGLVRNAGRVVDRVRTTPGAALQSGFLESANVDSVREMVDILGEQRAFETAQKTLAALDDARQKDVNDVVRLKG